MRIVTPLVMATSSAANDGWIEVHANQLQAALDTAAARQQQHSTAVSHAQHVRQPQSRYEFIDLLTEADYCMLAELLPLLQPAPAHVRFASCLVDDVPEEMHNGAAWVRVCQVLAQMDIETLDMQFNAHLGLPMCLVLPSTLQQAYRNLFQSRTLQALTVDGYAVFDIQAVCLLMAQCASLHTLKLEGHNSSIQIAIADGLIELLSEAQEQELVTAWYPRLCAGLATCHNLRTVALERFGLDDVSVVPLFNALATTGAVEHLRIVVMHDYCVALTQALADWLQSADCSLRSIHLGFSASLARWTDSALQVLLSALQHNTSITHCSLQLDADVGPELVQLWHNVQSSIEARSRTQSACP